MFFYDTALTDLTMPDSITSIGDYTLGYCVGLTAVTMPQSLAEMGEGMFYKCWKQLYKVEFPDEAPLTTLPANTFESCQALTCLYLGSHITSTGPVSLYGTNAALKVDCAVQESSFSRSPFDVYPYDLADTALFSRYEAAGKDDNGDIIYKVWLADGADFDSGGCGGTPSGDYYLIYAGATPTFTFGTAVPAEPVVLTLLVRQPDAEAAEVKTYTKSQLKAMAATAPVIGYQFWKNGEERIVAATEYVTLDTLLADSGLKLEACGTITATASDGYTSTMTFANNKDSKYFITADGDKSEVPAALALTWASGTGTLDELAAAASIPTVQVSENVWSAASLRWTSPTASTAAAPPPARRRPSATSAASPTILWTPPTTATCATWRPLRPPRRRRAVSSTGTAPAAASIAAALPPLRRLR